MVFLHKVVLAAEVGLFLVNCFKLLSIRFVVADTLIARFTNIGVGGFSISEFSEGPLMGLSLVLTLFFVATRRRLGGWIFFPRLNRLWAQNHDY